MIAGRKWITNAAVQIRMISRIGSPNRKVSMAESIAHILGRRKPIVAYTFVTMQRPEPIKITTALMALRLCIGITLTAIHPFWDAANIHPKGHSTVAGIMHAMQIFYAIMMVIAIVSIWCYWRGAFWARRVVILASLFYLFDLVRFGNIWSHSHARGMMTLFGAILALYLLWYLFTREAKNWFPWPTGTDNAERYRSFVIDK